MGLEGRKPVFGGLRATNALTCLIRAVWSAPLLFAYWKPTISKISLFQLISVALSYSENRFSHDEAHLI